MKIGDNRQQRKMVEMGMEDKDICKHLVQL